MCKPNVPNLREKQKNVYLIKAQYCSNLLIEHLTSRRRARVRKAVGSPTQGHKSAAFVSTCPNRDKSCLEL